jgi:multiple sugar transport system permease protein
LTTVSRSEAPGSRTRARRWLSGFGERETWAAYAFLAPWILGFLIFTSGPMVASLVLSFTEYDVINPPTYIGAENYRQMLDDPKIVTSMRNTLVFTLMLVPLTMGVGLALALMLSRVGRAGGFFRTAFYMPNMTPPVAVGILFLFLFNGTAGVVNRGLEAIGIPGPFWTTDPTWVKPGLALMGAWSVGGTMVIYLAALKGVPQQLYEAAAIDGASAWRRFRTITLPMISPALYFTGLILTIAGLQSFTEAYTAFYGTQEGTTGSDAALFYVIYLFQQGFQFLYMGYASAMAWLLFAVILIVTAVQVQVTKRYVFYFGGR